ncbi:MAG: glutamate racemase [Ruminococcaceae bacterium]|nr:glutamate racemase [Oscillospiraceae bacterium]
MDNRRIGLFDSGLGGLTVMKELMALLPNESIVYFGDTGRIPYGSKSVNTVIKYTKSDINFLNTFDLKAIIAACGTVSSIALPHLRGAYDVPIMGVVASAARAAARATKNGCIGVIGTAGTIRSGAYRKILAKENPVLRTVAVACPLFVHLVEGGFATKEAARLVAEEYLAPIRESGADTLILGCTHYPLLRQVITQVLGEHVTLINPGYSAALEIKEKLASADMLAETPAHDQYRFYVSDDPADFTRLGSVFLERPIEGLAEQVDIEQYL